MYCCINAQSRKYNDPCPLLDMAIRPAMLTWLTHKPRYRSSPLALPALYVMKCHERAALHYLMTLCRSQRVVITDDCIEAFAYSMCFRHLLTIKLAPYFTDFIAHSKFKYYNGTPGKLIAP